MDRGPRSTIHRLMQAAPHIAIRMMRLELRPLLKQTPPRSLRFSPIERPFGTGMRPFGRAMNAARDLALMTRDYLRLGIALATSGKLLGTCALWGIDAQCRRAEIGCISDSQARSQGHLHEVLTALIDYGFTELNLNRGEADTDSPEHLVDMAAFSLACLVNRGPYCHPRLN